MKAKKNSKANLEKSRGVFFLVGILLVLGVVLLAFNYSATNSNKQALAIYKSTHKNIKWRPIAVKTIKLKKEKKEILYINCEPSTVNIDTIIETCGGMEVVNVIGNTDRSLFFKEPEILFIADKMPEFPGGDEGLMKFIADHVVYPQIAKETGVEGKVYVRFCINASGNIERVSIARGVDPLLDNEAMRVVKILPKWKPGENGGRKVSVWYTVPIVFKLK